MLICLSLNSPWVALIWEDTVPTVLPICSLAHLVIHGLSVFHPNMLVILSVLGLAYICTCWNWLVVAPVLEVTRQKMNLAVIIWPNTGLLFNMYTASCICGLCISYRRFYFADSLSLRRAAPL